MVVNFDPVIFSIPLPFTDLSLPIRWYALAYVVGLLVGWRYCMRLARRPPNLVTPEQIDDFLLWAIVGVIVGGRLGIVLFYQPSFYLSHPAEIVKVWKGGMSFHGGLAGVTILLIVFARRHRIPFLALTDIIAAAAPIGLFLGRIANFINGELWGRPTDVPWAMIFPNAPDRLPRHPSQLYEASLEGLVLFLVLAFLVLGPPRTLRRPGLTTGVFLAGYALGRGFVETMREPDSYIGLLTFGTTWGQWLSLPMLLGGAYLVGRALKRQPVTA